MLSSIMRTNSCASGICYGSRSRYTLPKSRLAPPTMGKKKYWHPDFGAMMSYMSYVMSCGFLGGVLHRELAILTRFYAIFWFSGNDWELHPIGVPVSPCLIIQGLAEHRCNATYVMTITAYFVVTQYIVRVGVTFFYTETRTSTLHSHWLTNKYAVGEWMQGSIWVNACKKQDQYI